MYSSYTAILWAINHPTSEERIVVAETRIDSYTDGEVLNHEESWVERALDPTASLPVMVALMGALIWVFRYITGQQQELGRLRFLETISNRIDSLYHVNIKPTLDKIEDRLDSLSEESHIQQVKQQNIKDEQILLDSRLQAVEQSIKNSFCRLEKHLEHSLEALPCVEKIIGVDKDILRVIECPNEVEPENRFYPRLSQHSDELD
jgi:hypothetical protein